MRKVEGFGEGTMNACCCFVHLEHHGIEMDNVCVGVLMMEDEETLTL